MTYFWIAILALGLLIDVSTSGFLFSVFSIGSLLALISKTFGVPVIIQVFIFLITSILLILNLVPYIRKKLKNAGDNFVPQEMRIIGTELILEHDLINTLQVNINGVFWTIKTLTGPISAGEKIKIVSIEGNKYIVETTKGEKNI